MPAAWTVEPSAGTKRNAGEQSTHRTQGRARVTQALARVRKAAQQRRKEKVTALFPHLSVDLLREASREHRRAKTDRLDTELLKRSFLGWLRGERDHCKMVAIPTTQDEDAKRPNREHESLVGEQSRIVNRMKATLIRFAIRAFNPNLNNAPHRLTGFPTPHGAPTPPDTLAELRRDL